MTKKDFELIAGAMRSVVERGIYRENNPAGVAAHSLAAQRLADALATTNPRFDRAKFLQACGVAS